ncbi:hypothetical protein [Microcoleus sp. K4-C2]|uniref:hypothetical protein n=1 Tax=Microcoleus sp. K4-C2 TaxID=2818792 RepID=UPI002FCF90F6
MPQEATISSRSSKQAPLVSICTFRVGYVDAQQLSGGDAKAEIWNGGVTFAFPDLFSEGNVGGLIIGVPAKVTRKDIKENKDNATSLHVEALDRI